MMRFDRIGLKIWSPSTQASWQDGVPKPNILIFDLIGSATVWPARHDTDSLYPRSGA